MDRITETYLENCKEAAKDLYEFLKKEAEYGSEFESLGDIEDYINDEFDILNPKDLLEILLSRGIIIYNTPNYVVNKDKVTLEECMLVTSLVGGLAASKVLVDVENVIGHSVDWLM